MPVLVKNDPLATPDFGSGDDELPEDRVRSPLEEPAHDVTDFLARFMPPQAPHLQANSISLGKKLVSLSER